MKLALAHDHLLRFGGAERVLKELSGMFPSAPLYTLYADRRVVQEHFPGADIKELAPALRFIHRPLLPLHPVLVELFDLREYDVVLSSSSMFMKGIITRAHTRHVAYCHTPPRFLWEDAGAYAAHNVPRWLRVFSSPVVHGLRLWDQNAAARVDTFLANSQYTQARIERYYRQEAAVIYPPVDTRAFPLAEATRKRFTLPQDYFLYVGRLAWWKMPELVVETFSRLGFPLVVAGEGPMRSKLQKHASLNVQFLGFQEDAVVRQLMHGAQALVHPQVEDFGIAMAETLAQGTPIIAFRRGGAEEIIREGKDGLFFDDQHPIALADAVRRFTEQKDKFNRKTMQEKAQRFSADRFRKDIRGIVEA